MFKLTTSFILILLAVTFVWAQGVPPAPTNLTATDTLMGANLEWNSSAGAFAYRVYKAVDGSPFMQIAQVGRNHFTDPMVFSGFVYRYFVTAFNHVGESLPSNEVVFTLGGSPPTRPHGIIAGTVVNDSTGNPVPGVRIRFFKTNGFMYFREARTDSLGNYSARLDTGAYFVFASKWTYIPEWFDNSLTRQGAELVAVTEGNTSYANFGLTQVPPPPPPLLVTVSGNVTDSATGAPISGAFVVIMRTNRQVNIMNNYEGTILGNRDETFFLPGFGTLLGVMRVARTDSNGNYDFKVPNNQTYIMLAYKHGYLPEFYNNKTNPFDADRLLITSDISGINFDLVINPNVQNSLAGQVKDADDNGVISKVVLFKKTPRGLFPVRCAITDSVGNYFFNYLYSGYYYAKAVPFANYAPAWYDIDSCGIIRWANADSFFVEGNLTGIDICVNPIIPGGFASIAGTVRETGSTAVQGVTVYAVSPQTNSIINYDITENDGTFEIQNLAPGSYKIVVDKEGYSSSSEPVYSVSEENNYTVNNAEFSITNITLGAGGDNNIVPSSYSLKQNYPNPFNPSTEIQFGLPLASSVNISVYNILGQQVAILFTGELNAGNHSVIWNGTDAIGKSVSSGIYFYKITANSLNGANQFINVRKMMLIK
ncbi:MAG: carboxypeptidase regulatory-like domain-containing protein [Bacteroidota bacterium]|nr:carboxypeptidase regulatory-like domain-containing protein [Bacteroidota bacterium]